MNKTISFQDAVSITLASLPAPDSEICPLEQLTDRVLAEDAISRVDSPSIDSSLKDGFAVLSTDIQNASPENPITLKLEGTNFAGKAESLRLKPGTTIRILTGAAVPEGANAVLAEEFASIQGDTVIIRNVAEHGRNILLQGSDVRKGEIILDKGTQLHPAAVGLLASAGLTHASVIRFPSAALIATGDEVVAPGNPLQQGKLYASNLVTLAAWCSRFGFTAAASIRKDDTADIKRGVNEGLEDHDMVITSGGAWSGERDLVVKTLESMGWNMKYHRVRIGPGKGVAYGLLNGKPVFCLPGGPPSNLMAFLQLVLPSIQKMAGFPKPGLPVARAVLSKSVTGQPDWTQFIFGMLEKRKHQVVRFSPLPRESRLQMLASTEAILSIPEGMEKITAGETVEVQLLK